MQELILHKNCCWLEQAGRHCGRCRLYHCIFISSKQRATRGCLPCIGSHSKNVFKKKKASTITISTNNSFWSASFSFALHSPSSAAKIVPAVYESRSRSLRFTFHFWWECYLNYLLHFTVPSSGYPSDQPPSRITAFLALLKHFLCSPTCFACHLKCHFQLSDFHPKCSRRLSSFNFWHSLQHISVSLWS